MICFYCFSVLGSLYNILQNYLSEEICYYCTMKKECEMKVRRLAGAMVMIGLTVGTFVSPYGYAISALVGISLIQSSFTGICPPKRILPSCRGSSED